MSPVEGSLDTLTRAVLSEAQGEADQILSAAKAKAENIRTQAQEQAEAQRKEILERARLEADRLRRQSMATAQLEARTLQLDHREKLLNQVFEEAGRQLISVQQWTEYGQIARKLLREALIRLESPKAILHADKTSQSLLTGQILNEVARELNVEIRVGEPLQRGTGIVVETEDGRLRYDNTLETRLNRMQTTLRAPVYHILMGESL
jgi:V/A-type H+-transporting ATPase subunit E